MPSPQSCRSITPETALKLLEALKRSRHAISDSYMQCDAEWRDHDAVASRYDHLVQKARAQINAAIALAEQEMERVDG